MNGCQEYIFISLNFIHWHGVWFWPSKSLCKISKSKYGSFKLNFVFIFSSRSYSLMYLEDNYLLLRKVISHINLRKLILLCLTRSRILRNHAQPSRNGNKERPREIVSFVVFCKKRYVWGNLVKLYGGCKAYIFNC